MKFSIVTPSFNQGTFIERTLQSVADQTGFEIEHVVFDGGSTDRTVDILKARGNSISWTSEPDRGQADAVNKGIRATSGEIIGWLNSDDVYYPGAFAQVSAFFEAHADIDVVYGMADHIDRDGVAFEAYPTEPWDFFRLKDTCFICQPAVFFRRRIIEQHGLLDENAALLHGLRILAAAGKGRHSVRLPRNQSWPARACTSKTRPSVHASRFMPKSTTCKRRCSGP